MNARRAAFAGLLLSGLGASHGLATEAWNGRAGESIYRGGTLSSGAPLEGVRGSGGLSLKGAGAACVNCHRRSGLGATEGSITIPPIAGGYLFHTREGGPGEHVLSYVEGVHGNRASYTEATLARAIREGLDPDGKPLNPLMPRFALNDTDMRALIDYLKTLNSTGAPGVSELLLHFATIITPDADPGARSGMLDVLNHYFADKNSFPFGPSPKMRTSGKTMYSKSMYVANRRWQLHVWQLSGPEATWRAQLKHYLAAEPVLAVISGLGASHWAAVHDFCEQDGVPCLFPNIEVPVVERGDFYSLYLSKGVLLEAELIAKQIGEEGADHAVKTVLQVYRAGDSGEPAARALAKILEGRGIEVRSHVLAAGGPGRDVREALRGAASAGALVLWLRPSDVMALGDASAAPAKVFLSGQMGGMEGTPLSSGWRERALVTYLFDLPDRRVVRLDYPLGWFSFKHIPVVAEEVQLNTYLACGVLAETLSHMADTIGRDYLVERMQEMLDHRILTGYYPRLSLASGQTLASKGGYLVKFAGPTGRNIVADGDWTVP